MNVRSLIDVDSKNENSSSLPFSFFGDSIRTSEGHFAEGMPFAYLVALLLVGVGLFVGFIIPTSHFERSPMASTPKTERAIASNSQFVGRITGMVDCKGSREVASGQWPAASEERREKSHLPSPASGRGAGGEGGLQSPIPKPQSLVALGDKFILTSGLMEVTYDTGAKVILQGPVTYEVDSAVGGYLLLGKLTARIEKKSVVSGQWSVVRDQRSEKVNPKSEIGNQKSLATDHRPLTTSSSSPQPLAPSLFVITTPTATVTDLGTEFGVEVDAKGNTTSSVFRGLVQVQPCEDGNPKDAAYKLHENEAVRIENNVERRATRFTASATQIDFVRKIPKTSAKMLDLADVVAGGDGFSHKRDAGIDATTGLPVGVYKCYEVTSDGQYHRVAGMPLVDGVFMPSTPLDTPVQVDSAGHTFSGFVTKGPRSLLDVWVVGPKSAASLNQMQMELAGVDYASEGHGALFMHANKGITFNLEAIRQANPGLRPVKFLANAGNVEKRSVEEQRKVQSDIFVLIDGQLKYRRREICGLHGAYSIAAPIAAADRFLTLVAADSGDGADFDWIVFGDPRLEMISQDKPQ